tara:strand:- start:3276 stop:3566 length:291 start_codon:yes stop_codon:yes gene_type:complete
MIVRCAHDYDVVIHKNTRKGMTKKVRLADSTFITLTYPNSKNYFLRVDDEIVKKSDSFKVIEDEYVKVCKEKKDSDDCGRIDIIKHKIVANKVMNR